MRGENGERVTACIVLKQKYQPLDPPDIKFFLKTYLSPSKMPKEYIFFDELPKSSTGKILERELEKQIMEMRWKIRRKEKEG